MMRGKLPNNVIENGMTPPRLLTLRAAGMFYWIRSLQTYDDGWNYIDNLKSFVQGGLVDDSFIDAVSGIVNRGCHNPVSLS